MIFLLLFALLSPSPLVGQSSPDTVRDAERLRDAGDLRAAVRLLDTFVGAHPDNGDALRLLAQTLYWLQDFERARQAYERGLARHPADTRLRLEYGRMLLETGDRRRARVVLTPLVERPGAQADARTLLGTLAYWEGDLTNAKKLFLRALQANPSQDDARRQLQEIASLAAHWIRVGTTLLHDDQPLDRLAAGFEAGWFATPLLPIKLRAEPRRYAITGSRETFWTTEIGMSHFAPALRLETEVAGGVLRRPQPDQALEWTGHAVAGVRLPRRLTLRARAERAPYLYTTASIGTPVMTEALAGEVRWDDPRGWLGQAAYRRQSYPDGNTLRTRYAWLLVPAVRRPDVELQFGYAFATEHADENRFVIADPEQRFPPGDPRFNAEGRYVPYYTPTNLVTHAAVAALTLPASPRATFRLGGSYPIRATEDAPEFIAGGAGLQRVFVPREFSPWTARGSIEIGFRRDLTVSMNGELGRTAFYRWASAGIQTTYRFVPGNPR